MSCPPNEIPTLHMLQSVDRSHLQQQHFPNLSIHMFYRYVSHVLLCHCSYSSCFPFLNSFPTYSCQLYLSIIPSFQCHQYVYLMGTFFQSVQTWVLQQYAKVFTLDDVPLLTFMMFNKPIVSGVWSLCCVTFQKSPVTSIMKFLPSHLHLFDVAVDNPDVVNLSNSDINATLFRRSFDPYKFAGFDHNGLAILTKVPIADTDAHEIHISTNISLLLVQLVFPGPPFLSTLCTF